MRHLDSGELISKAFRKESNGSDLFYGQSPLQGPTEKWMEEGRGVWAGDALSRSGKR